MKNTKTIDLKVNGENFNQNNYQNSDNLDAILVCGDDIAKVRVTSYDEVIIEPITKKNIESKEFINFLDELEDEYNVRNFLISTYYEYLYPFMYDDQIKDNKKILLEWVSNNLKPNERTEIKITSFSLWESKIIISRSEDLGVNVDYYDDIHKEPIKTFTYRFEDFEEEPLTKIYSTACGLWLSMDELREVL